MDENFGFHVTNENSVKVNFVDLKFYFLKNINYE